MQLLSLQAQAVIDACDDGEAAKQGLESDMGCLHDSCLSLPGQLWSEQTLVPSQ